MSGPVVNLSRYVFVAVDSSEASREVLGKDTDRLSCSAHRWHRDQLAPLPRSVPAHVIEPKDGC